MPNWSRDQEVRFLVPDGFADLPVDAEGYKTIDWFLINHTQQGLPAAPDPVQLTQNGNLTVSVQWPWDTNFNAADQVTFWQLDFSVDEPGMPPSALGGNDDSNWRKGLDLKGLTAQQWPSAQDPECWILYCAQSRNVNVKEGDGVWTLTMKLHVTIDGDDCKFRCDPRMCVGDACRG